MTGRGHPARPPAGKRPAGTPDRVGPAREPRDSGASSIELVLLAPLVILSILLVGQFAMWYQARHVAIAAAQAGARVARDTAQGLPWEDPATTAARSYARQLGGSLLLGSSGYFLKRKANGGCQPAQTIRMGNPTPFVAEDGLTSRPAMGAFLPGSGVHASGDAVQGEALSLTGPRYELCEGKMFH